MVIDKPCPRRLSILQSTYRAMQEKVCTRKGKMENPPTGLCFKYHYQVYLFLELEAQNEGKAIKGPDLISKKVACVRYGSVAS